MKFLNPLILAICLFSSTVFAQTRYGLTHSNYAGTQRLQSNPAYIVHSPLAWDYNLIGLGVFLDNSMMKIPNNSLLTIGGKDFRAIPDYFPRTNLDQTAYLVMNVSKNRTNLGVDFKLSGPAFMFSTRNVSMGFFHNVRANLTMKNFNKTLIDFFFSGMEVDNILLSGFDIKNMSLTALAWNEFGFTYGEHIVNDQFYKIKAGFNAKILTGVSGYAINVNRLAFQADPTLTLQQNIDNIDFNLNYAYTNPNNFSGTSSFMNGWGLGVDAGILIEEHKIYKKRFGVYRQKYEWQLGFSLTDIGALAFTSKNTLSQKYTSIDEFTSTLNQTDMANNEEIAAINDRIWKPRNYGSTGSPPVFILPTALRVHLDRNINQNFYANARLVLGAPSFGIDNMLRTPHNFILAPRYESRFFDFSLPLVLHDFRHFRYGFNARFYFFSIGSDNIANIFRKNGTITGADIYFSIRLYRSRRLQKRENKLQEYLRTRRRRIDRKRFKIINPAF